MNVPDQHMPDSIEISVALVTRNRPASLRRCLVSWRSQTVQPFEIVISDDSDDLIRPLVQNLAAEFDARWTSGPRRGLYANRNHVASSCQGTHVFSSDDDHEHPVDFLEKCLLALKRDPHSAWCLGEVWSWKDVSGGWMLPGELTLRGAPNAAKEISDTWAWSDGATICPREVFDSGLFFCETFRFGWCYLEFGSLLHAVGLRIRILTSTGVIHHLHEIGRSFRLPTEELAASYFSLLMLALVYQPTFTNQGLLLLYLLKQLVKRPICLMRALPWAVIEMRKRTKWFREWQGSHVDGVC